MILISLILVMVYGGIPFIRTSGCLDPRHGHKYFTVQPPVVGFEGRHSDGRLSMELQIIVKTAWAVNFFFFALVLLFVWSKIYVVGKKIQATASLLDDIAGLGRSPEEKTTASSEKDAA